MSAVNQISVMVLGGVFFPTEILPSWLSTISEIIPITHALEVIRYLLMSDTSFNDAVGNNLIILLMLSSLLLFFGIFTCNKAIEIGKKNGTLTLY